MARSNAPTIFSYYYDVVTDTHGSASYFGRGICPSNPNRYVYLGQWQPSQASHLPYVQGDKVYRDLYGKKIEQPELTELLQKTKNGDN